MEIIADLKTCEGLGMCEAMADQFFEVGEDGLVHVLDGSPSEEHRALVAAAVESCPVTALRLQG